MDLDQSDAIILKGLKVHAFVGVLESEKTEGQDFYFDLYLYPGYSRACFSDRLEETINYAEAAYLIRELAQKSPRDLIEALAQDIATALLEHYPEVWAIRLDVHKPSAPIEAEFSDVVFSLKRQRSYPVKLALGSNMGDRAAYLRFAWERLEAHPQIQHLRKSRLFESRAWGVTEQADFLNAVVAFETSLHPWELLELAQNIEKQAGRVRKEKWGPRVLDVDIISYGDYVSLSSDLKIPHPYHEERDFVAVPVYELDHPSLARSVDMQVYSEEKGFLVVDCQYDFVQGSLACQKSQEAIAAIVNYLDEHPDLKVAYSLDWHSPKNQSFKENGGIWPPHCVAGTSGAQLDPAFTQLKNPAQRPQPANCFYKGLDDAVEEYSAYEAKRQDGLALKEYLPENTLVAGLASEFCVRESILALTANGFNAQAYLAGIGYVDEKGHAQNIAELEAQGYVYDSSER